MVALAVSLLCLVVGSPASAKLPAFCKGDRVPEEFAPKVALASKPESVAPGNYVYTRLLNGLNRPIGLGRTYLQRHAGGKWESVPPPDRPGGAEPINPPASRQLLPARSAGECRSFRVDPEQPLGRYRMVNEVYFNLRPGAKPRIRTIEFRIEYKL